MSTSIDFRPSFVLLCLAALALTLAAAARPAERTALAQEDRPRAMIWLEGEEARPETFNQHSWYSADGLRLDLLSPGTPGGAAGAWLAHYATNGQAAEARYLLQVGLTDRYTFWLRASSYQTRMWYQLDGGPRIDIDSDSDARETIRLNVPTGIDIRFLSWLRAAELDLDAGNHELRIGVEARRNGGQEAHGGIDALCLVNFPWAPTGALKPALAPRVRAADAWFPLELADDPFSADSATDLSSLIERPAGANGRVQSRGDDLVLADGTPLKFWGVNASIPATPELMALKARMLAKHGVNLARVHPVQGVVGRLEPAPGGGRRLNPQRLDRLDRWVAALKAAGIYTQFSPVYPHVIGPEDGYPADLYAELADAGGGGKQTGGFVNLMRPLQDAEWTWIQALMTHVNPYTGLSYAADPALAVVEVHNEDSVFWHAPLNWLESGQADGRPIPRHVAAVQGLWQTWLRARYRSDAELLASWGPAGRGSRAGDSLGNARMGIYGAWEMQATGPSRNQAERVRMGDFIRFLAEAQRGYFARRGQELRGIGYEGLTVSTAWWAGGAAATAANTWTDDALDIIDRHRYSGGMANGGWRMGEAAINDGSQLAAPGEGILSAGLEQVEDKPFMLSEWTASAPNEWKAEAAPLVALYGLGLQGWDASLHFHSGALRMEGGWPADADLFVTETPHYLGQFPALARAVHEGHIQQGAAAAARRLPLADIFRGVDPVSQSTAGGGWGPGPGDLATPREVLGIGRVSLKAADGLPRSSRVDWGSYWDQATGVIRSTTGELSWDTKARVVTVGTARTQGVIGFAGGRTVDLPDFRVMVTTPFVSLLLTSLDGLALGDSRRILVTALARDKQTGARYSADGKTLEYMGGPPLLLEPVQARITAKHGGRVTLSALDVNGDKTGEGMVGDRGEVGISGIYGAYLYLLEREGAAPEPTGTAMGTSTATAVAERTVTPGATGTGVAEPSATAPRATWTPIFEPLPPRVYLPLVLWNWRLGD